MDALSRLEAWYSAQCDGLWEHGHGVKIDTIDNPGWSIEVNLSDTAAENRSLDHQKIDRSDKDWIHYWVEQKTFHAAAGSGNLSEAIKIFCDWFENQG